MCTNFRLNDWGLVREEEIRKMGGDPGVDLVTLIIIVVMVCVATFSCTIFGRFCFDKYCRSQRIRGKVCPHGGAPDLPCGICARLAVDLEYFPSWRPYHPSMYPNVAPSNLNYAALLAAERHNTYTIGHHNIQNGSPGPTDLMESQKELPGPNNNSSPSVPLPMNEESGTFKRLGIRQSFSGRKDLSGIARQLENKNLSPIQQTPPDSQFPHDLSIAVSKKNPNSPLQTSQTSSFGSFRQRRSNSFHQTSVQNENSNNHNISSITAKSCRSIPIPGIKKIFTRHVGSSDLTKSPRSEEPMIRPSPIRRRIYQSPGIKTSPAMMKNHSAISANSSLTAHTTIEMESEKEIDEVDVIKHIGAPGNTIPLPLSVCDQRNMNISVSEEEEVFKPSQLTSIVKPPRLSAGGKIRTYRHRSLNDSGGSRLFYDNNSVTTSGFRLKRVKSLEDDNLAPGLPQNYCSYCGQCLVEHSKNRNGACSEVEKDINKYSKPSLELFQPAENTDEGEKTSSNSLGSPGIKSIIDSINAATARSSGISIKQNKNDEPPSPTKKQKQGYVNVPFSEAAKFSLELEKRGPLLISETMFKIPKNNTNHTNNNSSKAKSPKRKSYDVENSIKSVKSPIRANKENRLSISNGDYSINVDDSSISF
ncbi:uncharacterized protein [Lepeophtheirus salmonis]|uniref:uncharacterized protein isoform X2 n=1 Tax=Lepeophtheirus salmonis TaxID=72036 RepID=UPI001AE53516|nr:uncharacterized protein LOC121114140 isoform X2 [Lepeophtheirus salmonis]